MRARRRPGLRRLADWLRSTAHRIYPEPTYTVSVTTHTGTTTFINCQEWRG